MTLRFIQTVLEFRPRAEVSAVGDKRRGIYVLYRKRGQIKSSRGKSREGFDVLYVGMASRCIAFRLRSHKRDKLKKEWTHFSAYAVWPNIDREEILELEGLFRYVYRRDSRANILNLQRGSKALWKIRSKSPSEWRERTKLYAGRK